MIHKQQLSPFKIIFNSLKAAWGDKKGPLYIYSTERNVKIKKKRICDKKGTSVIENKSPHTNFM